jgi:Na+-driven multidrug efflux pump
VVGSPEVGKRVAQRAANFAMLAIVASFGTVFVAAYIVAREIRNLVNKPAWGIDIAARSLVGQEFGSADEREATAYGWDVLKFAIAIYVPISAAVFALAGWIAPAFTDDPATVEAAVPFIMVMAVSLIGLGVDSAASGIIGAAGDTRWPLYASLVGIYLFMLPIAYLGVVTRLGIVALYLAITAETVVPALLTYYRFTTDEWIAVSHRYRTSPTD